MSESDDISKQELAEAAGSHGEVSDQSNRLVVIDEGHPALIREPTLLEQALAQNVSSEQLQQFMDLQERYEANEARKAFAAAFVRCQKEMPAIQNEAFNKHTKSNYAKLEHINAGITPIATKHGFSISFSEGKAEIAEMIRADCVIRHKLGHTENHFVDMPLDLAGSQGTTNKTSIQAKKSSFTYACRTLLCMIFNLTVGDDVDGNAPDELTNYISKRRIEQLEELIAAQDDSFRSRVMEWLKGKGIESLENIPAESFDACLKSIKSSAKIAAELNNEDS